MRTWLPVVCLALFGVPVARAEATTYCVGVKVDGCTAADTAAGAFSAARQDAGRDTILLGRLTEEGAFADAPGRPVRVIGVGADATRLRVADGAPALRLQDAGSEARELRLDGGGSSGPVLQLDDGAEVDSAVVSGAIRVRGGSAVLSSVAVLSDGPAVQAGCDAGTLVLRLQHVTIAGQGAAGVSGACATAGRSVGLDVDDSIVWGYARGFDLGAGASLSASHSDFPEATGAPNRRVDPGFAGPGDASLGARSPLVDAGDPGMLSADEPHEDALGFVRVVDGDGDGTPRRDMGAYERQPPAMPRMAGNVLSNPAAEGGTAATDDTSSPAPPAWTRTGSFTSVRYGTLAGLVPFPTRRVSDAIGGGDAFFAAGPGKDGTATQVADLTDAAPEIDAGLATVSLSALLGGYRASEDAPIAEARFRGPAGDVLGSLHIGPVAPDARAGATTLLPRTATAAVPPLTRSVAVVLRSTAPSGSYDDAYFDNVALVPLAAGAPPHQPPSAPAGRRLRPFAGVRVTAERVAVDSRGRAWLRLACPSRTAGRCRGMLSLAARIKGTAPAAGGGFRRAARSRVDLRAGGARHVAVRLSRPARRALPSHRRTKGRVYLAVRDGQGVTRTSAVPVRIVRGTVRRRR